MFSKTLLQKMHEKVLIRNIILVVAIFVLTFTLAACSKSVSGTYYNQKNKEEYLELKSDGTFYVKEGGLGFAGKYKIDGNEITLETSIGMAAKGVINGNTITDEEGQIWIKE
ncbi:hypothetical protein SAMN05443428_10283 [Caloramator quimbayensis]|uniref:Uncharacterized protein n=1 Tax=Caloramator quimbayensis TaxID=1147123 RepID=A0A1T4WKW6_9CLOT|nr:hypothetical protein [Caloramator quimbayensis]SKA77944.1 hypothetical protein SAMN05443428_10283 [Caloramator quimbayensis]